MLPNLTPDSFATLLPSICDRETSANPNGWTPENPLWGHCAIVAMLAQDIFGGTVLRAPLINTPFVAMRSHYWNLLPSGERDFTADQFCGKRPTNLCARPIDREHMDGHPPTMARYQELKRRFEHALETQKA